MPCKVVGPTIDGTILYLPVNDNRLLAVDIRTELPIRDVVGHHCQATVAVDDGVVHYNTGKSIVFYSQPDLATRLHRQDVAGIGLSFFPQSGPATHGGVSYFAKSDRKLYAIRFNDNKAQTLWTQSTPDLVRSSVAIAGDYIYYGCDDGHIYATNRSDGKPAWRFKTAGPIASSPSISDGVLFIGSDDGCIYAIE